MTTTPPFGDAQARDQVARAEEGARGRQVARAEQVAPAGQAVTTVTPYPNGPLILRGDFVIVDPDGTRVDPGRRTVALCRCGRSALKPFCDGSHARVGFHAGPSVHRAGTGWRASDAGEPGADACARAGIDAESAAAVPGAAARPGRAR